MQVVLAVNYKPEVMLEGLRSLEEKYHVKLTCSLETEPMGTGAFTTFARCDDRNGGAARGCARVQRATASR